MTSAPIFVCLAMWWLGVGALLVARIKLRASTKWHQNVWILLFWPFHVLYNQITGR